MKIKNLKNQRRRVIPHCFQKRNLSQSNTSLSQLLSLAAYKKRIKDLVKNNRSLAVALQEARCDAALQNAFFKDYVSNSNQFMFARSKLKDMAKTIAKLVTDLDEIAKYLDSDWASNKNNHPFINGSHNRMRIKVPNVDCIEEESVLPSENEASAKMSVDKPCNNVDLCETEPQSSQCDTDSTNVEMPPILFVEDSKDNNKERSSSRNSRILSDVHQNSLTPKLDIDFSYLKHKRTSSRRQTQFDFTEPRTTRSRGKTTSSGKSVTPKNTISSSESVTPEKPSSFLMNCDQLSEANKTQKSNISESYFPNERLEKNFQGGSENLNSASPDLLNSDTSLSDSNVNLNSLHNTNLICFSKKTAISFPSNLESNHTVVLCEDMELTDVVHPVDPILENPVATAVKPVTISEIQSNNQGENDISKEKNCLEKTLLKLPENSESFTLFSNHLYMDKTDDNNIGNIAKVNSEIFKHIESFQNQSMSPDPERCIRSRKDLTTDYAISFSSDKSEDGSTPTETKLHKKKSNNQRETVIFKPGPSKKSSNVINDSQNIQTPLSQHSAVPARSSRSTKEVKYGIFFSSEESENDSTPTKTKLRKKKSNKNQSDVTFEPGPSKKSPYVINNSQNTQKASSQDINKDSGVNISVYDLNVSNSEIKKKPRNKKLTQKKEIPKPLLQNCNVTKLKGANYKFTKSKTSVSKFKEINQQHENCKSVLEGNSVVPVDNFVKGNHSNVSHKDMEDDHFTDSKNKNVLKSIYPEDDKFSSEVTHFKHKENNLETLKPEVKRVSFAATDLVCNFKTMSVSKNIADNRKVRRASKSTFEDLLPVQQISDKKEILNVETIVSSESTVETVPVSEDVNDFSGETELYTFMLPSGTHQTVGTANLHQPLEMDTSVTKQTKDEYDCDEDLKSKSCLTVNKRGRLSLKRNKNSQKKLLPHTSGKIVKDSHSSKLIHSDSPIIRSKCKSLPKESSSNDLKENVIHTNPQTVDDFEDGTQIKPKSFTNSHLQSIDECKIQIPIDALSDSSFKSDNLSQKHKVCQSSSGKMTKKSSISLESSAVLKDVMNLKVTRESSKRRSKVTTYKEPPLNKKMRRN